MRALRVLVVDDEPLGRQRLEDLLASEPDVEIVASVQDGDAAIAAIRRSKPDLVFLDVQMPGKSGLDVVREVGAGTMPATVFVTAYDQHAVAAFDVAAVDYIVKPFDDERFEQALRRARRMIERDEVGRLATQLAAVLRDADAGAPGSATSSGASGTSSAAPASPYLERIAVETKGQVRVVPVKQIEYIVASGPYAEIHAGERRYIIRERMQTLEERLDPARFFRIHRSAIVRIDLIETLLRSQGGDYSVKLRGGAQLKVSRNRIEELEALIGLAR
jgi:two-component system LytT family response regulator